MSLFKNIKDGVIGVFRKEVKGQLESKKDLSELEIFIMNAKTREEKFRAEILQDIALKIEEGKAEGDLENNNFIVYLSEPDYQGRGENRRRNFKNSLEVKCNSHARKLVKDYSNEPEKIEINIGCDKNLNYNKEKGASLKKKFADLYRVEIKNESQPSKTSKTKTPIIEQYVQSNKSQKFEEAPEENKSNWQNGVGDNSEIPTLVKMKKDYSTNYDHNQTIYPYLNQENVPTINQQDSLSVSNQQDKINYIIQVEIDGVFQEDILIDKKEIIIGRRDEYKTYPSNISYVFLEGNPKISRKQAKLLYQANNKFTFIPLGGIGMEIDSEECRDKRQITVNQKIQIENFTLIIREQ